MEVKKNIAYLLLLFLLIGCNKEGEESLTHVRDLTPFHSVELNDVFEVSLVEDSSFYVELIATPKMLEGVEVRVEDGVLYLDRENGNRWYRPSTNQVHVVIHAKPLNLVVANKTCNVVTVNPITSDEFGIVFKDKASHGSLELNCNSFYFWNNEPTGGYLRLFGQTNHFKIWNAAIMTVDAKDLQSNYALIENYSKGDCIANVNGTFDYVITGHGDIHLYGNPTTVNEIEDSGAGELIQY